MTEHIDHTFLQCNLFCKHRLLFHYKLYLSVFQLDHIDILKSKVVFTVLTKTTYKNTTLTIWKAKKMVFAVVTFIPINVGFAVTMPTDIIAIIVFTTFQVTITSQAGWKMIMLSSAFVTGFSSNIGHAITMSSFLVADIIGHAQGIASTSSNCWKVVEFICCFVTFETYDVWIANTLAITVASLA